MSHFRGNQHRNHHVKRKHDDRFRASEEEAVDDLLIASMAVASTWSAPATSTSESDSEGGGDESSDSSDGERNVDADEISLSSDHDEANAPIKEEVAVEDQVEAKGDEDAVVDTDNLTNPRIKEEEDESDDDVSDIDLTENLANMEDDDEEAPKVRNNSNGLYQGPKTEHEIDPYKCPTDELEKLNVCVATDGKQDGEFSILDEATRNRLRVAGTIRSYLVEQRTIVVDSLIPTSLQSQCQYHNSMNTPLDEGSMLAFLLAKGNDDTIEVTTFHKDVPCSVQVLGKIMEVFGPVQRPLYVIRLPDSPKVQKSSVKQEAEKNVVAERKSPADKTAVKMEEDVKVINDSNAEKADDRVKEETSSEASHIVQDANEPVSNATKKQSEANNQSIDNTSEKRKRAELAKEDDDPWSIGGKLSTVLRSTSNAVVYSLVDHSKLINKDHIIKVSGRGCGETHLATRVKVYFSVSTNTIDLSSLDASNVYDEEAGPNEQDFSDDEAEREAKKGTRKPRQSDQSNGQIERREGGGRGAGRGGRGRGRGIGRTHGNQSYNQQNMDQQPFYNAQQSGPVQHQYYNPQGYQQPQQAYPQQCYGQFHPGSQQAQYYPYQMQPASFRGYPTFGYGAPPPPPPPRQNNSFGHTSQQQHNGSAAPQSQTPSADGDTVYYDYAGS